jgi:hypothetical protein
MVLSFLLLFFLASCEALSHTALLVSIQENEIEKVADLRSIPGTPFTEEKQIGGKYFTSPYEDTASLHMVYMHFKDNCMEEIKSIHYLKLNPLAQEFTSQEVFTELNPRLKQSLGFFDGVCWVTEDQKILSSDLSTGGIVSYDLIQQTSTQSKPLVNSSRISSFYLKDQSLYFMKEQTVKEETQRTLYSIDYPSLDPSTLKELYQMEVIRRKEGQKAEVRSGFSKISHIEGDKIYGTFNYDTPSEEGTISTTGVAQINLSDQSERIVFQRKTREMTEQGETFCYAFLNPNGAWFGKYWMIEESIKAEDTWQKRLHVYDSTAQLQLIVEVGSNNKQRHFLKTHPDGTYLYWLDDYVLYRWKTPLS